MWDRLIQSIVSGARAAARSGRDRAQRPHHPVAGAVAAARRRHAGHLRRRHRPLPHRKRAARPQRRAGSGRQAQIRLHQACVLRTAHAAQHHPGLCRASGERRAGRAQPRARANMCDAIVSGSNTLKDLVNDILDLALIESGALRLELERIDLYELLARCRRPCRATGPPKVGLTLERRLRAGRRACSWPTSAACARSCSTFCPTPSNSRPRGGTITPVRRASSAKMCRSPSPTTAPAWRRK